MRVVDPGLQTTVQDLGRRGYQKFGMPEGGAMDRVALRVANALVGNDEDAAGLEITLRGPGIEFETDALIAVCGAQCTATIADVDVPDRRAVFVGEGAVLTVGSTASGCRSYLAIAGGIDVPDVMGSKSTYLRAAVGGLEGRALRAGDRVPIGEPSPAAHSVMAEAAADLGPLPFVLTERRADAASTVTALAGGRVRFVQGPHFELLDEQDRKSLVDEPFVISTRSDRMGYRLEGPALVSGGRADLLSSAVVAGTVQIPPDGHPIVLMVDRQTTGGYPVAAHVITADLAHVAQLRPGDEIYFEEVSVDDAQAALRQSEGRFESIIKELRSP